MRFSYIGYAEAIMSVIAQSVYLSYVQKTGVGSTLSVLHLNSVNCIPVMLIYTLGRGRLIQSLSFPGFTQPSFVVMITHLILDI